MLNVEWLGRLVSLASAVDGETTLQISLSASLQLIGRKHGIPVLGAIDLRVLIRDKEDSLWGEATLIAGHAKCLTIRSLRLLDSHTYRHSNVDMEFLTSRVFQMQ